MMNGRGRERATLLVTVAYGGIVVLLLEILGTRLTAPVLGTGLYVWAAQISSTMLGLAIGYWIGGQASARMKAPAFTRRLALTFAAIGVWLACLPWIARHLLVQVTALDLRAAAMVSSLILLVAPMLALGTVTPLAVGALQEGAQDDAARGAGSLAGRVLAISTGASIFGAVFTAFVLIPNVSNSRTLQSASALAFALTAALLVVSSAKRRDAGVAAGAAALMLGAALLARAPYPPRLVHAAMGRQVELKVVDEKSMRFLLMDGAGQTAIDKEFWRCTYADQLAINGFRAARPNAKTALNIGLGGGCMARVLLPLPLEVVDVEPTLPALAERYFHLPQSSYRFHESDGRVFLSRATDHWSLIAIDAFAADVPVCHMLSEEAFQTVRDRLEEGGAMMVNTIVSDGTRGRQFSDTLVRTVKSVFKYVDARWEANNSFEYSNLYIFASNSPFENMPKTPEAERAANLGNGSGDTFRDDFNPCDVEFGLETGLRTRQDDWFAWGLEVLVYQ